MAVVLELGGEDLHLHLQDAEISGAVCTLQLEVMDLLGEFAVAAGRRRIRQAHDVVQSDAQRGAEGGSLGHGDILKTGLHLADGGIGDAGALGQLLVGEAAAGPGGADRSSSADMMGLLGEKFSFWG